MIYLFYFVHIVISIFLILVVLLQQGKGADLSVFGGGASQAAFGARGAATLLHKLTVACFVLFIVTTLAIGILESRRAPSVMSDVATEEEEPAETPMPETAPAPAPAPPTTSGTADEAAGEEGATSPRAEAEPTAGSEGGSTPQQP